MGAVIPWTAYQDKKLHELYGKKSTDEIAEVVGRNRKAVQDRIRRLRRNGDKGFPKLSEAQIAKLEAAAAAKKLAPKQIVKPAAKPAPKQKPLSAKETDAILHQATAPRPPTWEEAETELREAIETACHAAANHAMTKQRCQMLLMAWNVLDIMEKV